MKKQEPIKISEMDVEPISDEDLRAIAGSLRAETDFGECCDNGQSEFVC